MSAAYAVIGWPLGHTLSPVMHQAALDEMGLEATYTALPTPPGSEGDRFEDVRTGKLAGLNVTIPHKLAAFRAMDRLTFAAERTGAVNTVIGNAGHLVGDNTDPYGFAEALRRFGDFDADGAAVVVLGAGGASRAVVHALLDSGARRIAVANRTATRGHELIQTSSRPTERLWSPTASPTAASKGTWPPPSCWSTPPAWAWPAAPRPTRARCPPNGCTTASSFSTSCTAPP